ncbi:hypothetical protein [Corynebacterium parakroppenstedtii]|uniref:hypothetical protein n=1 Tax=Corynebacterium parakroppenstedtii TaxID=2828363 RepID=UPI0021AF1CEC|nr:hypothetical protein [Corynebacterium parakroppenstedtii]
MTIVSQYLHTGRHRAPTSSRRRIRVLSGAVIAAAALFASTVASPSNASAAPMPNVDQNGNIAAPGRTQISFQSTLTGHHAGTANEHESRPGLSLVKMYIADYVFEHGTPEDQAKATQMLRFSDDNIASELYAKYPNSINDRAGKYHLADTHGAPHWGNSTTSTADSVTYLEAKKRENPFGPVLSALATASPVAADGYKQDYGTATLPGVLGTKWGWSDDRSSVNASASFGPFFSVSASTYGPSQQLTDDVQGAFTNQPWNPLALDGVGIPASGAPAPAANESAPVALTSYPARAVAQSAFETYRNAAFKDFQDRYAPNTFGPIGNSSPFWPTVNAMRDEALANIGQPIVNAVPESVPVPSAVVPFLPPVPAAQ